MRHSIETLQAVNVDEPEESVYHLLAAVLNLDWETGHRQLRHLHQNNANDIEKLASQTLTTDQLAQLDSLLQRRCQHEPLQYLLGKWDFHNLVGIRIVAPLLCPRSETEELVEYVLQSRHTDNAKNKKNGNCKDNSSHENAPYRILDIGCGTGCIGLALAQTWSDAVVTAIDVEPVAVTTANDNAQHFHLNERYQAQLCAAEDFNGKNNNDSFDLIVSNPPYILPADMDGLDTVVKQWESPIALCGGTADDGMDIVRTIVRKLSSWACPINGADCWMEVDPTHPALLQAWLMTHNEEPQLDRVAYVKSLPDFQGFDRFVHLRVKPRERME
jgi:release factor glutamine methyltransferase